MNHSVKPIRRVLQFSGGDRAGSNAIMIGNLARAPARQDAGPSRAVAGSALIISADDFGRCTEINHAIIRAHRQGILTSASLMIGATAAQEAVELARQTPSLAVGLHLMLADGRPVLPPAELPHLVDGAGRLGRDPITMGLLLASSRGARTELNRELRAQFERFAATGLPLTHVDGHMHMHVHPAVFPQVIHLAREFGAAGIRLPREPLAEAMHPPSLQILARMGRISALALLCGRADRMLAGSGIKTVQRCYGIARSGAMAEGYVAALLDRLEGSSAELVFHPTQGHRLDALGPNPADLDTLLSRRLATLVERRGLRLTNYRLLDPQPTP